MNGTSSASASQEGGPTTIGVGGSGQGSRLRAWSRLHPWVWSYAAVVLTWLAVSSIAGRGLIGTITSTFALVPFLVIVGIGQMLVITLGNGHIDLSIPNVLTLSAYVSTGVLSASHGSLVLGFLAPLLIAVLVAALNTFTILVLQVPPIVATLSVGLIVQSALLVYSGTMTASVDPGLVAFTRYRILGFSVLGLLCVLLAVLAGFVLFRTTFGRSIQAVGQSVDAARLTGLKVRSVIVASYVISAGCAAAAGVLLGAFSTPNLDLGAQYLLNSIAVVVLGGSLVAGGRSNTTGIWGAGLFLLLLLTLLDVTGAGVAVQNIVKGLLIILVLVLVGTQRHD